MTTPLVILAGQSNMVGSGLVAELPESLRRIPDGVRMYEDGAWTTFDARPRFGPEIGFAHAIAEARPGTSMVLLKVAFGGANLFYDWNPDATEGGPEDTFRGPMYPRLIQALHAVTDEPAASGQEFAPAAMLWMQGERDSVFEFMADAYERNLAAFIARVRSDTAQVDLPFIMGRINPRMVEPETGGFRHAWRDRVREAQDRIAASVRNVETIDTDDVSQGDDALHFNTAGQLELGRRYAQSWLAMAG